MMSTAIDVSRMILLVVTVDIDRDYVMIVSWFSRYLAMLRCYAYHHHHYQTPGCIHVIYCIRYRWVLSQGNFIYCIQQDILDRPVLSVAVC